MNSAKIQIRNVSDRIIENIISKEDLKFVKKIQDNTNLEDVVFNLIHGKLSFWLIFNVDKG